MKPSPIFFFLPTESTEKLTILKDGEYLFCVLIEMTVVITRFVHALWTRGLLSVSVAYFKMYFSFSHARRM